MSDAQRYLLCVDGNAQEAAEICTEVAEDLSRLGRSPLLVGLLANDDPAARMYANWTDKTCSEK